MSFFQNLFRSSPEKQLQKLRKKVREPHGDASVRINAAYRLYEMGTPEAILTLLERFTISVSPSTEDEQEKEQVLNWILEYGEQAIPPLKKFLRSQRQVYWPLRALHEMVSEERFQEIVQETLQNLWESPPATTEPQAQMIRSVIGKPTPDLTETIGHYLKEKDDDVTLAALDYFFALTAEEGREPVLETYLRCQDRPRVRLHILKKLSEVEWPVTGYRSKVEETLPEGFALTRDGHVKVIGQA